jgi:predicted DNA-binding transcriptional regulator AlpA
MDTYSSAQTASVEASPSQQVLLEGYLRRDELAQQLGVSARTIDRWHNLRSGPPRIAIGRTILYRLESVLGWLQAQESVPYCERDRRGPHIKRRFSR